MKNIPEKIRVLMIGADKSTGGGMWTVANSYINSDLYNKSVILRYIPTFIVGSNIKRIIFAFIAYIRIFVCFLFFRPHILHVHMSEKGSVYRKGIAINIALIFKCRIVIHMHGAEFQTWYESLNANKQKHVVNILNKADKVLILGEYWKTFIGTLIPLNRIEVLYNGVAYHKNIYNPDGSVLLFLGAITKRKGVYDLIKAFANIIDKLPQKIMLLIYGPDFDKKIDEEIKKTKQENRIRYCGWLNNESKDDVFSNTICNILPSYNEGLPMTILETMSAGIPNISTKIAAIPEVINQDNGYIISPGNIEDMENAIIDICNNTNIRLEKSQISWNVIDSKFSIKKNVTRLLEIYKGLLG